MLGVLRRDWAPEALAVSFKLETDEQLLLDKALFSPFEVELGTSRPPASSNWLPASSQRSPHCRT